MAFGQGPLIHPVVVGVAADQAAVQGVEECLAFLAETFREVGSQEVVPFLAEASL